MAQTCKEACKCEHDRDVNAIDATLKGGASNGARHARYITNSSRHGWLCNICNVLTRPPASFELVSLGELTWIIPVRVASTCRNKRDIRLRLPSKNCSAVPVCVHIFTVLFEALLI